MISDVIIDNSTHLGEQKSPYLYTFVNVTSNHTIESLFSKGLIISLQQLEQEDQCTPSGVIAVLYGASQSFNIVPDNEYEITDVIIDNVSQGALRSYTLSDVRADHLISAVFTGVRSKYNINATADPYTIVYPFGNRSFSVGSNKTYVTQPKPGSDLTDVIIDNYSNGSIRSWTFTNISSDHNISTYGQYTPGQVHVIFTANQTWGQVPMAVKFKDESVGDPTSFYWKFGDGTISIEQNPVHLYKVPGTFTVTLVASNNLTGGVGVWINAITVTGGVVPVPTPTPIPGKITAAFSAVPLNGSVPLDVSFSDESSGNPILWTWDFGDGYTSTAQNPAHRYNSTGFYSVTLVAQNALYSGSLSKLEFISVY